MAVSTVHADQADHSQKSDEPNGAFMIDIPASAPCQSGVFATPARSRRVGPADRWPAHRAETRSRREKEIRVRRFHSRAAAVRL
jgi:hypothetical protein